MSKKIYDFKNDVLFKYALSDEKDPDSQYLLRVVIEGYVHIKCKSMRVLNPDLNPENYDDKEMILDVEVELKDGTIIDIEMQNTSLSSMIVKRFQIYGAEMLARQLKPGENYSEAKHVYQILFVDDQKKDFLVDKYTSKNQYGEEESENMMTRLYIYLPYINDLKEQKPLSEFTEAELATYIFKNGFDDDIMKLQSKVIDIMKEKQERFNEDDKLRALAYKSDLAKATRLGEQKEFYDNGFNDGQIIGKEEGVAYERYAKVLKFFKFQYPDVDVSFLEGLSLEKYDEIFDMILFKESLEDIVKAAKE